MIKDIAKSAIWLAVVQVLNFGIPVIILPIATRAFGISTFGTLAAMTASATYVGVFITYGFNLTGPRSISRLRNDVVALSREASEILAAQLVLAVISSILFSVIVVFVWPAASDEIICEIILLQVVAQSLAPQWLFLGLERLKEYALVQLLIKGTMVVYIFYTIRSPSDVYRYVSANALGSLFSTLASFGCLWCFGVRVGWPRTQEMLRLLGESTSLFFANLCISLYTTSNVLIVNALLGPAAAGAFALADKIRQAATGSMGPVVNAIYPFICRTSSSTRTDAEVRTKRQFFQFILIFAALLSLIILIASPILISTFGGTKFSDAADVLRLMAPLPLIIAISNICGIQTMLPLGMDRILTLILFTAAFIGPLLMTLLALSFDVHGAAVATVLVEGYVTMAMLFVLRQRMSIKSIFLN